MQITLAKKLFEVRYEKLEAELKNMFPSYEGYSTDEANVHFNFTEVLSGGEQDALITYWNELEESDLAPTPEEQDMIQQKHQREWGQAYVQQVVDMMGARNLELTRLGTPVNMANILSQLLSIKELMNTGALKTALTAMNALRPSFPDYAPIFDKAILDVTAFLVDNGYMEPPEE